MTTYLCAVGVDNYDDLACLQYAVADAHEIHAILTDKQLGTAGLSDGKLLVENDATRENVANVLGSLGRRATDSDVLIFFFAGHAIAYEGETYLLMHGERADDIEVEQL